MVAAMSAMFSRVIVVCMVPPSLCVYPQYRVLAVRMQAPDRRAAPGRSAGQDVKDAVGGGDAHPRARRGVEAEGAVSVSDVARPGEDRDTADVTGAEPEDALAGNLGDLVGGEGRDTHPGGDAPALVAPGVAGLGGDVGGGGDVGHGPCSSLCASGGNSVRRSGGRCPGW